jgi:hypothetical protein
METETKNKMIRFLLIFITIALVVFLAMQLWAQDTLLNNTHTGSSGGSVLILIAVIIECIARLVPTKFDLSIISNLLRLIDRIIPNKYKEVSDGQVKQGVFKVRHKITHVTAQR